MTTGREHVVSRHDVDGKHEHAIYQRLHVMRESAIEREQRSYRKLDHLCADSQLKVPLNRLDRNGTAVWCSSRRAPFFIAIKTILKS